MRVKVPHALLLNAEYHKVLRLNVIDVRLVRHGQRATAEVVDTVGVELCGWRVGARVIRVFEIADVTAGVGLVIRCRALVTSQLDNSITSSGKLHDVIRVRGVGNVTMEPPLVEGHVRQRVHGTTGDGNVGSVKSPHAGVPDS